MSAGSGGFIVLPKISSLSVFSQPIFKGYARLSQWLGKSASGDSFGPIGCPLISEIARLRRRDEAGKPRLLIAQKSPPRHQETATASPSEAVRSVGQRPLGLPCERRN